MKLIIGLGNPEEEYHNNRHNVGHIVIDNLLSIPLGGGKVAKKTNVYMNDSSDFVKKQIATYNLNPTDLYIVHDDLDIKLGEYKIQFGKGPKGHKGILDIEEKLDTTDFWRVRVGVENRKEESGIRKKGEDYVLVDFTEEEKIILDKTIKEICKKLVTL